MRNTFLLGAAALALLAVPVLNRADEPKAAPFFDGKTLEGWEAQPGWWTVHEFSAPASVSANCDRR